MFKTSKKAPAPDAELTDRVARLEGLMESFLQYSFSRGKILNALSTRLPEGTVERGLVDLMFTLERDAFAKTFAIELQGDQQAGHEAFVSLMSKALRQN